MFISRNVRKGSLAIALLAGSVISAQALAQGAASGGGGKAEDQLHGSYSQPLGKNSARGRSGGNSNVSMYESNGDDTFSLTINNGTISAEHNGKPVPPDQIERKENVVVIKDKDGKTIKTFDVAVVTPGNQHFQALIEKGIDPSSLTLLGQYFGNGGVNSDDPASALNLAIAGQDTNPPPVMVGITMSDVDGSVLEHLNLEEGSAFSVDRVIDGLPAEKGGLKPHDVVTAIDGQTPATQEKFREILRGKKAGEHLELKIIRQGKPEKVTLDLVAYDATKLGTGQNRVGVPRRMLGGQNGDNTMLYEIGPGGMNAFGGTGGWSADARKKLEEALAEIKNNPNLQPEKIKAESQRALEEALKALTETRDVFRQRWQAFRDNSGNGKADVFVAPNEAQPFIRLRSQAGGAGDDRAAKHMERLSEQLDRLNKRLDELEKRLDQNDHK